DGWSYDDLLPYFKRSEDNQRLDDEYHGTGGPLTVSDSRSNNPMCLAFVEAAIEAGLPRTEDFNGAEQDGAAMYQLTQRGGMRCSAAVAFLHPAMERPNLTVMPFMHAHRVLFEGARAVGVAAQQLGDVKEFRAEREVILSGGAYNSPQLLMLSGIGPAEHLTMREIEVLLDQPLVGENLIDHPAVSTVFTTPERVRLLLEIMRQPAMRPYSTPFTVPADETDDALREHIARHTTTLYHPVGTCAMGGVVDTELRVNGVEALRAVDASVMPMVPRGNTNAPTIAVAERAADL